MARGVGGGAARFGGRLDTFVLAGCIILALVASALPDQPAGGPGHDLGEPPGADMADRAVVEGTLCLDEAEG